VRSDSPAVWQCWGTLRPTLLSSHTPSNTGCCRATPSPRARHSPDCNLSVSGEAAPVASYSNDCIFWIPRLQTVASLAPLTPTEPHPAANSLHYRRRGEIYGTLHAAPVRFAEQSPYPRGTFTTSPPQNRHCYAIFIAYRRSHRTLTCMVRSFGSLYWALPFLFLYRFILSPFTSTVISLLTGLQGRASCYLDRPRTVLGIGLCVHVNFVSLSCMC